RQLVSQLVGITQRHVKLVKVNDDLTVDTLAGMGYTNRYQRDVTGHRAHVAVAKALGIRLDKTHFASAHRGSADVGGWEIKASAETQVSDYWPGFYYWDGPSDQPVMFVRTGSHGCILRGWLYGHECQASGQVRASVKGRTYYYVLAETLRPLSPRLLKNLPENRPAA